MAKLEDALDRASVDLMDIKCNVFNGEHKHNTNQLHYLLADAVRG